MTRVPPPGGSTGTIDVTPEDVEWVAKQFGSAQNELYKAWTTLQTALNNAAGMAGNDDPANAFNKSYAPAVAAAWKALQTSLLTLGGISTGLTQTANNFLKADHDSSAGTKGAPATFTPEPVIDGIEMASPPSAIGPGETVWFLPGPLSRFWPNAHTDKVQAAAAAWQQAAGTMESIAGNSQASLASLEANDDTTQAINGFWTQVYSLGDPRTVLAGAQLICESLAKACTQYAQAIDAKRSDVQAKLIGAGILVGLTTAVGILGTVFTGGGSDAAAGVADEGEVAATVGDVAAETSATVEADLGTTIGSGLVETVEAAADDAPAVETADAETTEVQGDLEGSLDKDMADAEGDDPNLSRLSDPEAATLTRLQEEFPDRDITASAEERDGEYIDNQGRTYDQMGDPQTSKYWNPKNAQQFYAAIRAHLLKSINFTVIDLTGFSPESITDITNYVDSLPEADQAKIIRIGF